MRYIKTSIEKESSKGDDDSTPKPSKAKQPFKMREVVQQLYRERIEENIPFSPKDKGYIGCYQHAVMNFVNNMSEEERKEVESTLESWNKQGLPQAVQLK